MGTQSLADFSAKRAISHDPVLSLTLKQWESSLTDKLWQMEPFCSLIFEFMLPVIIIFQATQSAGNSPQIFFLFPTIYSDMLHCPCSLVLSVVAVTLPYHRWSIPGSTWERVRVHKMQSPLSPSKRQIWGVRVQPLCLAFFGVSFSE